VKKMDVQGLKVLVIDDSNTIRRTAETLLAKAGCNVATASNGFDSLAKIVFIYVQHIDNQQVDILMRMIETQTGWPTRHATTGQLIEPGTVTLVSPRYETRLCKRGWMLRFNSPWQGQYAPSIDSLALGLALKYKHNSGLIIFTGMGDDGVKGCQTIVDRGGRVWVQDPAECTASAMPSAVVGSGKADFVGSVEQLAERICMETHQMEACSQ
jgi:chemosensory pili system protein ChpB (putative protein-glutamate methylesterase)